MRTPLFALFIDTLTDQPTETHFILIHLKFWDILIIIYRSIVRRFVDKCFFKRRNSFGVGLNDTFFRLSLVRKYFIFTYYVYQ